MGRSRSSVDCDLLPWRWRDREDEAVVMGSTVIAPAMVEACHVITGEGADYDSLLELIGDRRLVLIGEASHGTI